MKRTGKAFTAYENSKRKHGANARQRAEQAGIWRNARKRGGGFNVIRYCIHCAQDVPTRYGICSICESDTVNT